MAQWVSNLKQITGDNQFYRDVVYTTDYQQIVLMMLKPGEEIGREKHREHDQFIYIESGYGVCQIGDTFYQFEQGYAFSIPRGTYHNVINQSESQKVHLYTIYSPPMHEYGLRELQKPASD